VIQCAFSLLQCSQKFISNLLQKLNPDSADNPSSRAGKNLRFSKKRFRFFRFLGFLDFNVRTLARWTQEYDQEEGLKA